MLKPEPRTLLKHKRLKPHMGHGPLCKTPEPSPFFSWVWREVTCPKCLQLGGFNPTIENLPPRIGD